MQTGTTSGAQIVFLSFAVLLLAVPLSLALQEMHGGTPAEGEAIGRAIPFVLGVLVAMAFPGLRHRARADLAVPIPAGKRAEVLVVTIAKLSLALAFMGGIALWRWLESGSTGLEQVGSSFNREASAAFAFSPLGLVMFFLVAAIVGPVLEELLFRDFLQRAWEKKWGWAGTVVMTSTLFALYHRHFVLAFVSGVVFSCAVRRTGSLWSAIAVHSCQRRLPRTAGRRRARPAPEPPRGRDSGSRCDRTRPR